VAEPAPIRALADAERAHITATLRETNWVIGRHARGGTIIGPICEMIQRLLTEG
jgi:hypothetical protein